jgi:hypothetical protein
MVDWDGARGLIKITDGRKGIPGCWRCNVHVMSLEGRQCPDCPFKFNSRVEGKRSRVYPGKKFRKYGWAYGQKYGKHTFFYFLYHPWMNCQFPNYPQVDLLGNRKAILDSSGRIISGRGTKRFQWHIHHLNGNYWDDSPWNLLLCLNTEHGFFEADVKYFNKLSERIIFG